MTISFDIEGGNFSRAGFASSEVKKLLRQLSVDADIIKRIVIALYEGEVNVVAHAYSGKITIDVSDDKVVVVIDDKGPGIPDVNKAMEKGYSTASEQVREMGFGAGMGLPNMKKNADELRIDTIVGHGTRVEMTTYFG
jgi:anti-sigma regulatory factor (Ser/Thr protein kinase)